MIWLIMAIKTQVAWPTEKVKVKYEGHEFLLRPGDDELYPDVCFQYPREQSTDEALLIVRRFLSILAWVERRSVKEMRYIGGGLPFRIGRSTGGVITHQFRLDHLPVPMDRKTQLALSLYREAISAENVPYEFLGYFKIINILYSSGREQMDWITATLQTIKDRDALVKLKDHPAEDIADHLYGSGRCAVAHANSDPVVDPDDPEDHKRLKNDMPIIKALAEYLIEHELGVVSTSTFFSEHLYELEGFREIFGPENIDKIKRQENIPVSDVPPLPKVDLGVFRDGCVDPLINLKLTIDAINAGIVYVKCSDSTETIQVLFGLDFGNERLIFDPDGGMTIFDNGTIESMTNAAGAATFLRGIWMNGEFAVWESETKQPLGRAKPFIPVNIRPGAVAEFLDQQITRFNEEAEKRENSQQE